MRDRAPTLKTNLSARAKIRIRRQNCSISHRKRATVKSYRLRSFSNLNVLNSESESHASSKHTVLAAEAKTPKRIRYTDGDDYAILNYIISHDLLGQLQCRSTWSDLETAGVTRHSADSMRCRFFKNIICHIPEVLRCTAEGRLKYSDPRAIRKFHLRCLSTSHSPKGSPSSTSPLARSNLSYFTSDNSPHDGDQQNIIQTNPQSSRQLPVRLVDYDDTQSNPSTLRCSVLSNTSTDVLTTPQKRDRTFTRRRLCFSSPSGRRKGGARFRRLKFRRQRPPDTGDTKAPEVIVIDHTPPDSPLNEQTLLQTRSSNRSSQTISMSGSKASTLLEKSDSADLGSSPTTRRGRRRGGQVDLDASKDSEVLEDLVNVETVPDAFPEASISSSDFIAGTQEQSFFSPRVSFDVPGDVQFKFPLMEAQPSVSNEDLLSRTIAYTRQLDSFARHQHLSSTDASLLLHATSGDLEAASSYLETGKRLLWFPSDDARLLSTSVADIHAVISKFGSAEVSRRLIYLSDRTLFS